MFMSHVSCPECGAQFPVLLHPARSPARRSAPLGASDPLPYVVQWLATVPEGTWTSMTLQRRYRDWAEQDPTRPRLGGPQLGRRLGLLGYRKRKTSQGRHWEITPQARSADLGAMAQAI